VYVLQVAAIAIGVTALYTLLMFAVRRSVSRYVQKGHNDVLVPIFLTAGTVYAVLLAFIVIAVWQAHDAADANAAEEASTLATMYRQTVGMPPSEGSVMRRLIRGYTESVVEREWPIQARDGGTSLRARRSIAQIYRSFGELKPAVAESPISVEFLRTFSTVAADRNRRTLQAGNALPGVLWFVLFFGAAIVVTMTFFLYMDVFWLHYVISAAMTLLIVTLLIITSLLDHPFAGPLGISADGFTHAIAVYDSVDRGD
jgi:hypothetical protein